MVDTAAVANVDFQNPVHVVSRFASVPDTFRVDDHAGTELAPVQATRGIDADALQSHFLGRGFQT